MKYQDLLDLTKELISNNDDVHAVYAEIERIARTHPRIIEKAVADGNLAPLRRALTN